jgi:hypothetical protein
MFSLTNEQIIAFIVLIISYFCFANIFAKEDNNNDPNKIPVPVSDSNSDKIENYSDLPDYSEGGVWGQRSVGPISNDCYKLNETDCLKTSNCGLCLSTDFKKISGGFATENGKPNAKCMPGDYEGPLFKEGCERWVHANYRDRSAFRERTITISPPHDYRYPDYEALWSSPQSRATLM